MRRFMLSLCHALCRIAAQRLHGRLSMELGTLRIHGSSSDYSLQHIAEVRNTLGSYTVGTHSTHAETERLHASRKRPSSSSNVHNRSDM